MAGVGGPIGVGLVDGRGVGGVSVLLVHMWDLDLLFFMGSSRVLQMLFAGMGGQRML